MSERKSDGGALGHVLALIPARGGSKSIPRKNIRLVAGKPLVAFSIEQALASSLISRVIVTTDSEEIAGIARSCGAETPFLRPAEFATDTALDIDFHLHAIEWLREHECYEPRFVVNLRPTHPTRQVATIDRAISVFAARQDAESLRSVRQAELSPFKMWRDGEDGFLVPVASLAGVVEPYNLPRQALPMVYWQDGYVDITRPSVIREQRSTTGRRILPFLIEEECVDIDYEDQIAAAERLLSGGFVLPAETTSGAIAGAGHAVTSKRKKEVRNPS